MAAKHPGTTPTPAPVEPVTPPTDAEAEQAAITGLDPDWVRRFTTYTDADGDLWYVDQTTGATYQNLPAMHTGDGGDT